jgi:hypothetical protein
MIALNCDQYRPEPGSRPRCLMGSFRAIPNATRARAAEEWPKHLPLSPHSRTSRGRLPLRDQAVLFRCAQRTNIGGHPSTICRPPLAIAVQESRARSPAVAAVDELLRQHSNQLLLLVVNLPCSYDGARLPGRLERTYAVASRHEAALQYRQAMPRRRSPVQSAPYP